MMIHQQMARGWMPPDLMIIHASPISRQSIAMGAYAQLFVSVDLVAKSLDWSDPLRFRFERDGSTVSMWFQKEVKSRAAYDGLATSA